MRHTLSPRLMPSEARPARQSSTSFPTVAYVVHVHWPPFFVPKSSRGPYALGERSNISTRFANLMDDIAISLVGCPRRPGLGPGGSPGTGPARLEFRAQRVNRERGRR